MKYENERCGQFKRLYEEAKLQAKQGGAGYKEAHENANRWKFNLNDCLQGGRLSKDPYAKHKQGVLDEACTTSYKNEFSAPCKGWVPSEGWNVLTYCPEGTVRTHTGDLPGPCEKIPMSKPRKIYTQAELDQVCTRVDTMEIASCYGWVPSPGYGDVVPCPKGQTRHLGDAKPSACAPY